MVSEIAGEGTAVRRALLIWKPLGNGSVGFWGRGC